MKHNYLSMETEADILGIIAAANIWVSALGHFPLIESWCKTNLSDAVSILGILLV